MFKGAKGLCHECFVKDLAGQTKEEIVRSNLAENEVDAAIDTVMLTTEAYPQGLTITRRIEVVTAECAFGMNIFKDLFAGVRYLVGGRSQAVQKTMRVSRRAALYELEKEAHAEAANPVVAFDLDTLSCILLETRPVSSHCTLERQRSRSRSYC